MNSVTTDVLANVFKYLSLRDIRGVWCVSKQMIERLTPLFQSRSYWTERGKYLRVPSWTLEMSALPIGLMDRKEDLPDPHIAKDGLDVYAWNALLLNDDLCTRMFILRAETVSTGKMVFQGFLAGGIAVAVDRNLDKSMSSIIGFILSVDKSLMFFLVFLTIDSDHKVFRAVLDATPGEQLLQSLESCGEDLWALLLAKLHDERNYEDCVVLIAAMIRHDIRTPHLQDLVFNAFLGVETSAGLDVCLGKCGISNEDLPWLLNTMCRSSKSYIKSLYGELHGLTCSCNKELQVIVCLLKHPSMDHSMCIESMLTAAYNRNSVPVKHLLKDGRIPVTLEHLKLALEKGNKRTGLAIAQNANLVTEDNYEEALDLVENYDCPKVTRCIEGSVINIQASLYYYIPIGMYITVTPSKTIRSDCAINRV